MSKNVKQPIGQKLLTNVSVVKLKRGGKRFELACYPNKVQSWRLGVETDLDEVLQLPNVFTNVQKGVKANNADLQKAFGDSSANEVIQFILAKGEVQLSEKEREHQLESLMRDICTIIAQKCINSETQLPVTVTMTERALKELHFAPSLQRSAKQQALEAIKILEESSFPIRRSSMHVRVSVQSASVSEVEQMFQSVLKQQISSSSGQTEIVGTLNPKSYREMESQVMQLGGQLEVMSLAATDKSSNFESVAQQPVMEQQPVAPSKEDQPASKSQDVATKPSGPTCTSCKVSFEDAKQHRAHFRTDWHRVNVKRKVEGKPPVDEQEANLSIEAERKSKESDPFA